MIKSLAITEKVCYNKPMKEKVQYKIGEEVIVNFVWAMVEEVDGKNVYVIDEEGETLCVESSAIQRY